MRRGKRFDWMSVGGSALLMFACNKSVEPKPGPAPVASTTTAKPTPAVTTTAPAPERYGAALSHANADAVGITELLSKPEQFTGRSVTVSGRVRRACSRKGCWMELAETLDDKAPGCRVTFKDYAFFVPTNSAGASARVEAVVEVERVEPAKVQHLEEEGAIFANKSADGSAREVRLVASGVELSRG